MKFKNNISMLQTLVDDYYHDRINFTDYRQQRAELMRQLDEELNGVVRLTDDTKNRQDETLLGKALSFLKMDSLSKIN